MTRESLRERLWPANTFVEFDASLSVAVGKLRQALGDEAENPRFIETIPRRGYRFIAPVEKTTASLDRAKTTAKPALGEQKRSAWRGAPQEVLRVTSRHAILIGLVAAALVGAIVLRSIRHQHAASAEAKTFPVRPQIRRSVAVLGFRNLPGRKDEDWLSQAFTEMIGTELAASGNLRVVADEDVARAKRELPLSEEETLAKATLERLRRNPGADVVVVGSYTSIPTKDGVRIRLDVRLQDTASGETIAEDAVTGSQDNLFELATQAGAKLREGLGLTAIASEAALATRAALPSNESAMRFYSEGKAKLWSFQTVAARDLLLKAVAADPNYPLAHSALSDAWYLLGYGQRAQAEAKLALDLSRTLPQEDRLLIEGSYWQILRDWTHAIEAYRSLFQLHPDNLKYGINLAVAQYHVSPTDSLATLGTLRSLPSPSGEDPRIDLVEASAQIEQDLGAAQAAAKRAVAKGKAEGSHLIVARAYGILCQQGSLLGVSMEEAIADCQNAMASYAAAGDFNNRTRTMNDLAGLHYQRGELMEAEKMWRATAAEFRKSGETEGLAASTNNIGDVLLQRGELAQAKAMFQEAIPGYQAVEDKAGLALALNDLAELDRQQGKLDSASTTFQQALPIAKEVESKAARGYVLIGVGEVAKDRGDLAAARKSYEEALELRRQSGEKMATAETQVALALLAIEEGKAADAESSLRKCREQFEEEKESDDQLMASIGLIQSLLAQGKIAEAEAEAEQTKPQAERSQTLLARLQFELVAARIQLASGSLELARSNLRNLLKEAQRRGYLGLELETRLHLAELDKKTGHTASAQTQLAMLEKVASSRGFGLIARKAAAARA